MSTGIKPLLDLVEEDLCRVGGGGPAYLLRGDLLAP